jgi:superfamily II DNA helicase RecQ
VLDDATFKRFSALREIRKRVGQEDGVPAYAVFTDAELAEIDRIAEEKEINLWARSAELD